MASPGPPQFPVANNFSLERVADHVLLMRRFQRILQDVRTPVSNADSFPALPEDVDLAATGDDVQERWRVQAFLMNAEVRYSLYLRLLRDWVVANPEKKRDKDAWPLPPWDAAIIFYTHLIPLRFYQEAATAFPELWAAGIEFPLPRLARRTPSTTDAASEEEWIKKYRAVPYQVITFKSESTTSSSTQDDDNYHAHIAGAGVLDIHGFRCLSKTCSSRPPSSPNTIPMAQWSNYRLGSARLLCPVCSTAHSANSGFNGRQFHAMCQVAFGVEVWELSDAPLRQFGTHGFIETILDLMPPAQDSRTIAILTTAQTRYLKFLQLMATPKDGEGVASVHVPTVDIDLFWHSHLLSPVAYEAYCLQHVGRKVHHDDGVAAPRRTNGLDSTKRAWVLTYGEPFLDPHNATKCADIAAKLALHRAALAERDAQRAAFEADATVLQTTQDKEAAEAAVTEAEKAAAEARLEGDKIYRRVTDNYSAQEDVKPRVSLFGRRVRWYSKEGKKALAKLEDDREALHEEQKAHLAVVKEREEVCKAKRGERGAATKLWRDKVDTPRRELHERLDASVAAAEEAAVQCDGVLDPPDPDANTEKSREMYAVVGSEAHPVVAVRPTVEKHRFDWVRTWASTYHPYHTQPRELHWDREQTGLQPYRGAPNTGSGGVGGSGWGVWGMGVGEAGAGGDGDGDAFKFTPGAQTR